MTELSELQAELAEKLLYRRSLTRDSVATAFAEQHLAGNDRLSPVEQLEIYREQFWLRHTQALVEDFPGVGGILGQSGWERLVEEYLGAHPPTSFTLRDLGDKLPRFVADCRWIEQHELVSDMARLEWVYADVFDAEDPRALTPDELAHFGEDGLERARLRLQSGLRLLRLAYPVVDLRKRILLAGDDEVPLPQRAPSNLVVFRAELAILHEYLDPVAFRLLEGFSEGLSLEAACESACALGAEATVLVGERVGEWLATWVQRKWITGLEVQ